MSVRGQFESISYSTHIFVIFLGEAQAEMRKVCSMTKEKGIAIILLEWPIYVIEEKHKKAEETECDGKRINLAT